MTTCDQFQSHDPSASHRPAYREHLGAYRRGVDSRRQTLLAERILERIWAHDHSVWRGDPADISIRLGWLHCPTTMGAAAAKITAFARSLQAAGYRKALLLGMGGSSLAPEVFGRIFGPKSGCLDLEVLDSTDPGVVQEKKERLNPDTTLVIVSSKSGGTVETRAFLNYFYNHFQDTVGPRRAGEHFIAITDPGSALADQGRTLGFRKTFLNDPNIGGRYSALSYFGLVPAALLGVDLDCILERATRMAAAMANAGNTAQKLGSLMGELALGGRDKLTVMTSPALAPLAAWIEQLVAESTGKSGRGVVPIVGESYLRADEYGDDRLFVCLRLRTEAGCEDTRQALITAGHPVVELTLDDRYDLGAEFFRWELAVAVTGHCLGINPFDQPDVEAAKRMARQVIAQARLHEDMPDPRPDLRCNDIGVFTPGRNVCLDEVLLDFSAGLFHRQTEKVWPRPYVAIQAYVKPDAATDAALERLRACIQRCLGVAVTVGYGPRYLHSSGQLHKGDAGNGRFIQITADMPQDLAIPDLPGGKTFGITFGFLKQAQAMGDRRALVEAGRWVAGFHLKADVAAGVRQLTRLLCPTAAGYPRERLD